MAGDGQKQTIYVDNIGYDVQKGLGPSQLNYIAGQIKSDPAHIAAVSKMHPPQAPAAPAAAPDNGDLLIQRMRLMHQGPVAPLQYDQSGHIVPSSVRLQTSDERIQNWAQGYRAQQAAQAAQDAKPQSTFEKIMSPITAPFRAVGAIAHGADIGAARIIRGATGQGTGPVPEDVSFLGQVIPQMAKGERIEHETAANHPELGTGAAVLDAARVLASPANIAMMAGPGALGAVGKAVGLAGAADAGATLTTAAKIAQKGMAATIPGGVVQGAEDVYNHPSAGTAVGAVANLIPAFTHGASLLGGGHAAPAAEPEMPQAPLSTAEKVQALNTAAQPVAPPQETYGSPTYGQPEFHSPSPIGTGGEDGLVQRSSAVQAQPIPGQAAGAPPQGTRTLAPTPAGPSQLKSTVDKIHDALANSGSVPEAVNRTISDRTPTLQNVGPESAQAYHEASGSDAQAKIGFHFADKEMQANGSSVAGFLPYATENEFRGLRNQFDTLAASSPEVVSNPDAYETKYRGAISGLEGKGGVSGDVLKEADALYNGGKASGNLQPLAKFLSHQFQTASSNVPTVDLPDFDQRIATPEFQADVDSWNRHIGDPLETAHQAAGGIVEARDKPVPNLHVSLISDDRGAGGPGRGRVADTNMANRMATGQSTDYDMSPEAQMAATAGKYRSYNTQNLLDKMVDEGIATRTDAFKSPPETIPFRGQDVRPENIVGKTGATYSVPPVIGGEISDITRPPRGSGHTWGSLIRTGMTGGQLFYNAQEFFNHMGALMNVPASELPSVAGDNPLLRAGEYIPFAKKIMTATRAMSLNFKDPKTMAYLQQGAQSGFLPAEFADPQAHIGKIQSFLRGPEGVDARVRIVMMQAIDELNDRTGTTMPESVQFQKQGALGKYNPLTEGTAVGGLKKSGLQPYATQNVQRNLNAIRTLYRFAGFGNEYRYMGGLKGVQAQMRQQLTGGVPMAVATHAVVGAIVNGLWPHQSHNQKNYNAYLKTGNSIVDGFAGTSADRGIVGGAVKSALAHSKEGAGRMLHAGVTGASNQFLQSVAGGTIPETLATLGTGKRAGVYDTRGRTEVTSAVPPHRGDGLPVRAEAAAANFNPALGLRDEAIRYLMSKK